MGRTIAPDRRSFKEVSMTIQHGRKSAASTGFAPFPKARPRPIPPTGLTPEELSVFVAMVSGFPHLEEGDSPLLALFAQGVVLAEKRLREKDVAGWDKAVRAVGTLGSKLRIVPNARIDPQALGRRIADQVDRGGPEPWENRLDDLDGGQA
jgi:hypothetical protein